MVLVLNLLSQDLGSNWRYKIADSSVNDRNTSKDNSSLQNLQSAMISVIIYIVTLMAKKDVQKGKIGRYFLIHNSHFHLHQIAPKG